MADASAARLVQTAQLLRALPLKAQPVKAVVRANEGAKDVGPAANGAIGSRNWTKTGTAKSVRKKPPNG